jgi:two-component sensor histidine kinase
VRDILGKEETRITVTGPDIMVSAQHVLTFSMAIYELFTNAMKYGALAQSGGRVQVACFADDHTSGFSWHEKPGAFLPEAANPAGFGSLLLMTMLPRELNGSTEMDLTREGLRFTLSMPASESAE